MDQTIYETGDPVWVCMKDLWWPGYIVDTSNMVRGKEGQKLLPVGPNQLAVVLFNNFIGVDHVSVILKSDVIPFKSRHFPDLNRNYSGSFSVSLKVAAIQAYKYVQRRDSASMKESGKGVVKRVENTLQDSSKVGTASGHKAAETVGRSNNSKNTAKNQGHQHNHASSLPPMASDKNLPSGTRNLMGVNVISKGSDKRKYNGHTIASTQTANGNPASMQPRIVKQNRGPAQSRTAKEVEFRKTSHHNNLRSCFVPLYDGSFISGYTKDRLASLMKSTQDELLKNNLDSWKEARSSGKLEKSSQHFVALTMDVLGSVFAFLNICESGGAQPQRKQAEAKVIRKLSALQTHHFDAKLLSDEGLIKYSIGLADRVKAHSPETARKLREIEIQWTEIVNIYKKEQE